MGLIKGIIFDLGGVYLNRGVSITFREKFARMFNIRLEEGKHVPVFYDHLYPSGFMSGRITEKGYWELCGRDLGVKLDSKRMRGILLNSYMEQDGVVSIVRALKGRYKLALLSDMPREWADWLEDKFNIFRNFEVAVVSGYVGMEKPNPGIYKLVLKRLGLKAKGCVFIDDLEKNLRYPQSIGMKTIRFESAGKLKKEMERIGIIV